MSRRSYPLPTGMKPCQICRLPASNWNIHGHNYTLCHPWHFEQVTKLAAKTPGQRVDLSLLDPDLYILKVRLWTLQRDLSPIKDKHGLPVPPEPYPEFLGYKDRKPGIPDVRPPLSHDQPIHDGHTQQEKAEMITTAPEVVDEIDTQTRIPPGTYAATPRAIICSGSSPLWRDLRPRVVIQWAVRVPDQSSLSSISQTYTYVPHDTIRPTWAEVNIALTSKPVSQDMDTRGLVGKSCLITLAMNPHGRNRIMGLAPLGGEVEPVRLRKPLIWTLGEDLQLLWPLKMSPAIMDRITDAAMREMVNRE
ncbi:MAG: hypothetical protein K8T26_01605 [Lentisphaerae bacterium]|nr:hypothetical protein [Lentisphaerota bacterium]